MRRRDGAGEEGPSSFLRALDGWTCEPVATTCTAVPSLNLENILSTVEAEKD